MATHPPATIKPRDRFFYTAMAVVAASLVFVGFARTYYLRHLFTNAPLKPLLHLHGFLFTSWLLLLLAQVTLVAAKRTDLHRRLGVAGGALAALMVVVGPIVAIHSARGEFTPNAPDPLRFLVIPLFDMLVFAIVVAAALYYRHQPQTHKRLMLVATFALLPAAVFRLPFAFIQNSGPGPLVFFGVNDLLLLAFIAYDTLVHRRLHPAYLWAGLLLIVSHPVRLALGGTSAWLAFAHWLTR